MAAVPIHITEAELSLTITGRRILLNHQEYETISPGKYYSATGILQPSSSREILVIGGIVSFEVTILICLLFTGFECEKGTVGMVPANIGNTGSE